jgi:hypothetical protein
MLAGVEFFPFFPWFVEIVVFVTEFSLLFFNKKFWAQKDSRSKNALFRVVKLEWLSNYACNGSMILSDSHKYGDFLFFVTYKASSTVQWVDPQTKFRYGYKKWVFLNRESGYHFIGVHLGKAHCEALFSNFLANFIIIFDVFFPDDSKSWVFREKEVSNGFLYKIVSLNKWKRLLL